MENVRALKMSSKSWKAIQWDKVNLEGIPAQKNRKKAVKMLF